MHTFKYGLLIIGLSLLTACGGGGGGGGSGGENPGDDTGSIDGGTGSSQAPDGEIDFYGSVEYGYRSYTCSTQEAYNLCADESNCASCTCDFGCDPGDPQACAVVDDTVLISTDSCWHETGFHFCSFGTMNVALGDGNISQFNSEEVEINGFTYTCAND